MRMRIWLPGCVYQTLPFICLGCGMAAMMIIPGALGFVLGCVLFTYGVTVVVTRSSYRNA